MARIAGVDVPREKRIVISLTYIYGIGKQTAKEVLAEAGVSEDTRTRDLTEEELGKIREILDRIKVEGDLRREVNLNIKRLIEIGSYRGMRHRRGLPVRGQNTKNNACTRKLVQNSSRQKEIIVKEVVSEWLVKQILVNAV